jgi:hypothetical protein
MEPMAGVEPAYSAWDRGPRLTRGYLHPAWPRSSRPAPTRTSCQHDWLHQRPNIRGQNIEVDGEALEATERILDLHDCGTRRVGLVDPVQVVPTPLRDSEQELGLHGWRGHGVARSKTLFTRAIEKMCRRT